MSIKTWGWTSNLILIHSDDIVCVLPEIKKQIVTCFYTNKTTDSLLYEKHAILPPHEDAEFDVFVCIGRFEVPSEWSEQGARRMLGSGSMCCIQRFNCKTYKWNKLKNKFVVHSLNQTVGDNFPSLFI